MLTDARLVIGQEAAALTGLIHVHLRHARRERKRRLVVLACPFEDLVVYVSDIAHVGDALASSSEKSNQEIWSQSAADVTSVRDVVDRRATTVDPDRSIRESRYRFEFSGQGTVQV